MLGFGLQNFVFGACHLWRGRWADHVTEEALDVQRPRGC